MLPGCLKSLVDKVSNWGDRVLSARKRECRCVVAIVLEVLQGPKGQVPTTTSHTLVDSVAIPTDCKQSLSNVVVGLHVVVRDRPVWHRVAPSLEGVELPGFGKVRSEPEIDGKGAERPGTPD